MSDNLSTIRRFSWIVYAAVILSLLLPSAFAQTTISTGSIQGTITDQSGALVNGAKVIITNKAAGQTITLTTSSSGTYTSGSLLPGNYVVRVEAKGFQTSELPVTVQVGTTSPGNLRLTVGKESQVVEVSAAEVRVNTEQAAVQGVITAQQIDQLPINGRNFLDAAQLEPGVQIQDGGNFDPTKNGFAAISIGGRAGRTTRIEVDGSDITDETVGTTTQNIPQDAIQEFQISQSTLDLSTELTSSGAVNVVTRTGTNSVHGDAYYGFRDHSLNASLPGGQDLPFQRNQFGGRLGGPIVKDRLFFFLTGERTKQALFAPVVLPAPFSGSSGGFDSPFKETLWLGRLDYQFHRSARLFYRVTYNNNINVSGFVANSYQPFANQDNTPGHLVGADFNTGSFTHQIRFSYTKFQNRIGDAVTGSSILNPAPGIALAIGSSTSCLTGGADAFCSGPNILAPQATYQSNKQVKYDGSKNFRSHIFRYGISYNKILGGGFAKFFGLDPAVRSNLTNETDPNVINGPFPGGAGNPLNYPVDRIIMGNGQGFFTEKPEFGLPAGGQFDSRFQFYIGDTWKIRPNFTVNGGLRYVHDTGRTDSDLPPIPCSQLTVPVSTPCNGNILDLFGAGLGKRVRQPASNFGPQLGFAWDPTGSGKTVIRAGAGLYYENVIFNSVLFDRPARLQNGLFFGTATLCPAGQLPLPDGSVITSINGKDIATQICGNPAGNVFSDISALQQQYQAATIAAGAQANGSFIGNTLAEGGDSTGQNMFAPGFRTPRSFQFNVGVQRELGRGTVVSADYVRNVSTHYLLAQDANHVGDARFLNVNAALSAITATVGASGCGPATDGPSSQVAVACYLAANPGVASIADFAANGLDSGAVYLFGLPASLFPPLTPDTGAAFPGQNADLGENQMLFPSGRSVYNGLQVSLRQNFANPIRGLKNMNLQVSYALSRFNSMTDDQDFINNAFDFRNTNRYFGPSSLDRTHQFSFGGVMDLPLALRLSFAAHFYSALPATLYLPPSGGADIFIDDLTGDGTGGSTTDFSRGDVLPGTNLGAFGRTVHGGSGLNKVIDSFNSSVAGTLTPAGQAVANAGLMTQDQLTALGGVVQPLTAAPSNQASLGSLRDFALKAGWVFKVKERLQIEPSISFFNLFNLPNFDPGNSPLSGVLDASVGSLNGTPDTIENRNKNRIGLGSGVFSSGSPRQLEFGLKISF